MITELVSLVVDGVNIWGTLDKCSHLDSLCLDFFPIKAMTHNARLAALLHTIISTTQANRSIVADIKS